MPPGGVIYTGCGPYPADPGAADGPLAGVVPAIGPGREAAGGVGQADVRGKLGTLKPTFAPVTLVEAGGSDGTLTVGFGVAPAGAAALMGIKEFAFMPSRDVRGPTGLDTIVASWRAGSRAGTVSADGAT